MNYSGMNILVVGMARTGLAAAEFLAKRGARVTINDAKPAGALGDAVSRASASGAATVVGEHPAELFTRADLIVISPGVPMSLQPVAEARRRGIPVVGDMEIAFAEMKGRICAITGSNGKTTTTALTGKILSDAGVPTVIAGNIGTPLIAMLGRDSAETWYVCEMSSFQLEATVELRPRIASILNVTPDHLDRYDTFGSYASAKRRIYEKQKPEDFLVLNGDDPLLADDRPASSLYYFSRKMELAQGCFLRGDDVVLSTPRARGTLMPVHQIPLKGTHNVENVMAAALMALLAGVEMPGIRKSIEGFRAVSHRLQFVAQIRGVDFYNDSKATNVDATIKALESFPGNLIVILGGKDKGSDYGPLAELCRQKVKTTILIGQAADKIASALEGACALERASSMEEAVGRGFDLAAPGDTVLLAPACASFDMFRDFEHRGDVFVSAVTLLKERVS